MMKSFNKKLALLLALIMMIVPFSGIIGVSAEEANGLPISDDVISQHILGNEIYSYDFTTMTAEDTAPEGWIHDFNNPKLQWCNTSAGDYNPQPVVPKDGYLGWVDNGWAYTLVLPELGTENYSVTMELEAAGGGSFGIAAGLPNDYTKTTTDAQIAFAQGAYGTAYDHYFELGRRIETTANGKFSDDTYQEIASDVAKNYFYSLNGNGEPVVEDYKYSEKTVTFTVNRYNNVSYFYVNGLYAGSVTEAEDTENFRDRLAIVKCIAGSELKIYSVTANEILSCYAGETIVSEDFSSMNVDDTTLPEGWDTYFYDGLSMYYRASDKTVLETTKPVIKEDENGEKYLYVSKVEGDQAITLPAFGTENYVLSAKVVWDSPYSSYIGLLTDIANDYKNTTDFTRNAVMSGSRFFFVDAKHKNTSYGLSDSRVAIPNGLAASYYDDGVLSRGELVDLTAIHYNNTTYFYVNGKYVQSLKDTNNAEMADRAAIWLYDAYATRIYSVKVNALEGLPNSANGAVEVAGAALRYSDIAGNTVDNDLGTSAGLAFVAEVDKTSKLYSDKVGGEYIYSKDATVKFGIAFSADEAINEKNLVVGNDGVAYEDATEFIQTEDKLSYSVELLNLPKVLRGKDFLVRGYMAVETESGIKYNYTEAKVYNPAKLANKVYEDNIDNADVTAKLDTLFAGVEGYQGANIETVSFTLFSDSHYYNEEKFAMTPTSVDDLAAVFNRAVKFGSDFVIHAGDYCNGYAKSPEWLNAYENNMALGDKSLPVHGVYGNHELEDYDTMDVITPAMTNQDDSVIWGTADGKIGDGSIAYYYFDQNGYRFICTDTNYNYDSESGTYVHAASGTYGSNYYLGIAQLHWLEATLTDAANKDIPCVVVGHLPFNPNWEYKSPDAAKVKAIYDKVNAIEPGTVIMSINGHTHHTRSEVLDGVIYYNTNALRVGPWVSKNSAVYSDDETFERKIYDTEGNYLRTETTKVSSLSMATTEHFLEEAMSVNVKISSAGRVSIDGFETDWLYHAPSMDDNYFAYEKLYMSSSMLGGSYDMWF